MNMLIGAKLCTLRTPLRSNGESRGQRLDRITGERKEAQQQSHFKPANTMPSPPQALQLLPRASRSEIHPGIEAAFSHVPGSRARSETGRECRERPARHQEGPGLYP